MGRISKITIYPVYLAAAGDLLILFFLDATTVEEGMKNIQDALAATIELYLEQGNEIPEPINKEEFKGNISYRTTSERHFSLAKLAQKRHISMNKALDLVFDAGIQQLHLR